MLISRRFALRVDLNNPKEVEEALHVLISLVAELRAELDNALDRHRLFSDEMFTWVWDDDGESDISDRYPELDPMEIDNVRYEFRYFQETLDRAARALMRVSAIPV